MEEHRSEVLSFSKSAPSTRKNDELHLLQVNEGKSQSTREGTRECTPLSLNEGKGILESAFSGPGSEEVKEEKHADFLMSTSRIKETIFDSKHDI
jgi:hypothetical protein